MRGEKKSLEKGEIEGALYVGKEYAQEHRSRNDLIYIADPVGCPPQMLF